MRQGVGKRYKIELIDDLDVDTPLPFIEVNVNQQLKTHAFIDTGAYGNTISHELYSCLKTVALSPTKAQFQDYSGHRAPAFGTCELLLYIEGLICGDKLFVTQP